MSCRKTSSWLASTQPMRDCHTSVRKVTMNSQVLQRPLCLLQPSWLPFCSIKVFSLRAPALPRMQTPNCNSILISIDPILLGKISAVLSILGQQQAPLPASPCFTWSDLISSGIYNWHKVHHVLVDAGFSSHDKFEDLLTTKSAKNLMLLNCGVGEDSW